MEYINKDITEAKEQIIIIPVNCMGKLSPTQSKLKKKYPATASEYKKYYDETEVKKDMLGSVQYILDREHKKLLVNTYCNYSYRQKRKIDTEAFKMCLMQIAHKCRAPMAIPDSFFYCIKEGYDKAIEIAERILADREVYIYKR